jgi:hypothetical protein
VVEFEGLPFGMSAYPDVIRFRSLLICLLGLLLVGCATTKQNVWDQRVGVMTYDEAVREWGPPDKKETTSDGVLVAEWLIQGSRVYSVPNPAWGRRGWYGTMGSDLFGWGSDIQSTPNQFLRLQFGDDGRLLEWKQFFR